MTIFFHFGESINISLSEIKSILWYSNKIDLWQWGKFASIDTLLNSDEIVKLQNKLWWTVKILKKIWETNNNNINWDLIELINKIWKTENSKLRFALNSFAKINTKQILMNIKKWVKQLRFLNNNFENVQSIVTKKQILDKWGIELNVIPNNPEISVSQNSFIITQTISIQDIEFYSIRDFKKPVRDMKVWMLPPKLAQILINLAWNAESIWDPFCWLWVIPIEAYLMWFKKIIYSDIEDKMVKATEKNLEWIKEILENKDIKKENLNIDNISKTNFTSDVSIFKKVNTDIVITEWYLWRPILSYANFDFYEETDRTLSEIWDKALENFSKNNIKKVVICLPFYTQKNNKVLFLKKTLEKIKQSKYTLQALSESERWTLIYKRDNQFVWREILKLEL